MHTDMPDSRRAELQALKVALENSLKSQVERCVLRGQEIPEFALMQECLSLVCSLLQEHSFALLGA